MTDILKHGTDGLITRLLPQQQILNAGQRAPISLIHKVIPAARVAVQHRGGLHPLSAVRLAALALERVVRIARRPGFELEQLPQRIEGEMALDVFGGVDDAGGEGLLVRLALEDFFFNGARGDEAVDETVLFLAVAPHARESLLVGRGVPVRIEEDEPVGADEVEAAAAGLAAEEEDELLAVRVVKLVDELLALGDVHGTVEAEAAVATRATELVEDVEGLRVVADEDDFVVRVLADTGEHAVEDLHLARVPGSDFSIAASGVFGDVIFGKVLLAAWEIM